MSETITMCWVSKVIPKSFSGHLRITPTGGLFIEADVGGVSTCIRILEVSGVWVLLVENEQDVEELSVQMPCDKDQWPQFVRAIVNEYLSVGSPD